MIRWMHYRFIYLTISLVVILAGIISLAKWGIKIGVDFRGGSLIEYRFSKDISTEEISKKVESIGVQVASIQKSADGTYLFRLSSITPDQKDKITEQIKSIDDKYDELKFETVGPTVGSELIKKTITGLVISASLILLWVWIQFKSARFGVSAVLAMLHDLLVVVGTYSIFSHFFGAEVDFLFVTGLLTVLSFSVHDTIVVYDRIRETQRKTHEHTNELADAAVSETMVRSLNNSLTVVFMLLALVLLGGSTVKWFAATLLVGTISGTYSSPFVAVPILVTWDEIAAKIARRKK